MAISITWLHSVSGNFNTAADWSGGLVPVILDDAELSATGTYTVTSSESNNVFGLELNANTKLAITEGTFIDADGTDGLDDAGTISIGNNTVFIVGFNSIVNNDAIPLDVSGAITLNSTGSPTLLILDGAGSGTNTIDLFGAGKLTLSANGNNHITSTPGTILENNATISGSGTVSVNVQNASLIDANGPRPLVFLLAVPTPTRWKQRQLAVWFWGASALPGKTPAVPLRLPRLDPTSILKTQISSQGRCQRLRAVRW